MENNVKFIMGVFFVLFISVIIFPLIMVFPIIPSNQFDVSNIPDVERWGDLNNVAARNRFCQAMGYTEAKIISYAAFGGTWESDYAGNPYGYDIVCKRTVPEKQTFEYSQYKKWLIQLEITNTTEE